MRLRRRFAARQLNVADMCFGNAARRSRAMLRAQFAAVVTVRFIYLSGAYAKIMWHAPPKSTDARRTQNVASHAITGNRLAGGAPCLRTLLGCLRTRPRICGALGRSCIMTSKIGLYMSMRTYFRRVTVRVVTPHARKQRVERLSVPLPASPPLPRAWPCGQAPSSPHRLCSAP